MATSIEQYDDPGAFLDAAREHLDASPVTSTVVATATERLAREAEHEGLTPVDFPRWWVLTRDEAGVVDGAAMRTAPFAGHPAYVLPMPEESARGLARALLDRGEDLRAVNGAAGPARALAESLAAARGLEVVETVRTRLFELGALVLPPTPSGSLRQATTGSGVDLELAVRWFNDFGRAADEQAGRAAGAEGEAHGDVAAQDVARRVAEGVVWFWCDETGLPVHLTAANPPSGGVARIGPVYTPPEHRGAGYASAAVAQVSDLLRAAGAQPCLFTDQANPISNRIYTALGYVPLVDTVDLALR